MSSGKVSKSTGRAWGKRARDDASQSRSGGYKPFVRFSALSLKGKLQQRKVERHEKKEMDRSMSYFTSVQRAIEEHASGGGEASALSSIVDGFFSELVKLLKADREFRLLRNGAICRAIEAALAVASLLPSKSFLYVLLGHIPDLIMSPVASYTLEALFGSILQALGSLADDRAALEAEMVIGGPGVHVESGVPSTATLLHTAGEEICERSGDLLVHEVGSRALRSIILALGGFPTRNARPMSHPVRISDTLGLLATSLVSALEKGYGNAHRTPSASGAWMKAAQDPTCSFVVQSLLRVSEEGSTTDLAVRQRLETLKCDSKPLLLELLLDPVGVHIFQAYLKVPTTEAVVDAGDRFSLRQHTLSTSFAGAAAGSANTNRRKRPRSSDVKGAEHPIQQDLHGKEIVIWSEEELLEKCCWGKAMRLVQGRLEQLLDTNSDRIVQTGYVLHDLVLYSPTAAHLQLLWKGLIGPHLVYLTEVPVFGRVLTALMRKCAFSGSVNASSEEGTISSIAAVSYDVNATLQKDENEGVRYFTVPVSFQQLVAKELCTMCKTRVAKGAAQYLLVEQRMGERSYELACYILRLHHSASVMLRHGIDKLRLEDVLGLCKHYKGSLVLQQYIRSSSSANPSVGARALGASTGARSGHSGDKPVADGLQKGEVVRFFRRIQNHLADLVGNKYAAFVIEVLYEVGTLELKEAMVKDLIPIYETLKATTTTTATEEGDRAKDTLSSRFIARKVLAKCCVEQYIYRREDWWKMAHRQCQVQRLVRSIALNG